ncbi:MAG: Glu/Leu/Phe/Val dehydrogenase [Patescibacteria group bacterium]
MSVFDNAMAQLSKARAFLDYDEHYFEALSRPKRIVNVSFPVKMDDGTTKIFDGYRVQYNDDRGPYKGGIRFHPATDLDEVKSLAFWMMVKCAVAGIPLGGSKGGVTVDPKQLSERELERLTRQFVGRVYEVIGPRKDIPAPDVYTTPQIMGWIVDEYTKIVGRQDLGVVTGKPVEIGGSLGRDTATAQGGFYVLEEVLAKLGQDSRGLKFAIQGFGNAGMVMADLLSEAGYSVVAAADSRGTVMSSNGALDLARLKKVKAEGGSVVDVASELGYQTGSSTDILTMDVDVLVPAALENQITEQNANDVKAKVVLELANGPTTPGADDILFKKGVRVIPDVLANAGGVVVSYFELVQNLQGYYWSKEEVFGKLAVIMKKSLSEVETMSVEKNIDWRTGAFVLALDRVIKAMKARGN